MKLPTVRELARQYGTSRATAEKALGILKAEGLVWPR